MFLILVSEGAVSLAADQDSSNCCHLPHPLQNLVPGGEGTLEGLKWVGVVVGWVGAVMNSRRVGFSQVVERPVVWWAEYAG